MKSNPADLVLLDSNALIYAEAREEKHYEEAKSLRDLALTGTIAACISPQVLSEFFSSITHTGPRGPEQPIAPKDAAVLVKKYYESEDLIMIYPGPRTIELMLTFLEAHPVSGARIHDLRLAATMVENGVTRIATYDERHFIYLPGIEVVDLSELVAVDKEEEGQDVDEEPA